MIKMVLDEKISGYFEVQLRTMKFFPAMHLNGPKCF